MVYTVYIDSIYVPLHHFTVMKRKVGTDEHTFDAGGPAAL